MLSGSRLWRKLHDLFGNSHRGRMRGDISYDHRTRADDRVLTDGNARNHLRAESDKRAFTHTHPTGQRDGGADMRCAADLTFVVDDRGRVDDRGIADARLGTDDRAGGDDHIFPDAGTSGYARGWMDGADQVETLFDEH